MEQGGDEVLFSSGNCECPRFSPRKGDCYDNAVVESFFSTLKNELVHDQDFVTREEAQAAVFEFIEVFYNRQRLHQTLGYVSPVQFEAADVP